MLSTGYAQDGYLKMRTACIYDLGRFKLLKIT